MPVPLDPALRGVDCHVQGIRDGFERVGACRDEGFGFHAVPHLVRPSHAETNKSISYLAGLFFHGMLFFFFEI